MKEKHATGIKLHKCPYCQHKSKRRCDLKGHISTQHPRRQISSCTDLPDKSKAPTWLRRKIIRSEEAAAGNNSLPHNVSRRIIAETTSKADYIAAMTIQGPRPASKDTKLDSSPATSSNPIYIPQTEDISDDETSLATRIISDQMIKDQAEDTKIDIDDAMVIIQSVRSGVVPFNTTPNEKPTCSTPNINAISLLDTTTTPTASPSALGSISSSGNTSNGINPTGAFLGSVPSYKAPTSTARGYTPTTLNSGCLPYSMPAVGINPTSPLLGSVPAMNTGRNIVSPTALRSSTPIDLQTTDLPLDYSFSTPLMDENPLPSPKENEASTTPATATSSTPPLTLTISSQTISESLSVTLNREYVDADHSRISAVMPNHCTFM